MSHENVEVTKRAMIAFGQRDLESYEELFTPDFEWLPALPTAIESFDFQDGGCSRACACLDPAEALKAVGLEE